MVAPTTPSQDSPSPAATADGDEGTAALPWAYPYHPNIDYSLAPFEQAHNEGDRISGWWVIDEERAAIDDSPSVVAINYWVYDARSFSGITALLEQCREGETSIVLSKMTF